MDKNNNYIDVCKSDDSDSGFLSADALKSEIDFGEIFSNDFSNITHYYSSPHGAVEIYSATRYGKRFILKGLKREYHGDPIYTTSLVKEFELGMQLDHPNIRRTIGLNDIDGIGKVIVLEYVDGCSLKTLISSGKLTISSARAIAAQIVDALGYIHSKLVYHRDLKPENILVSHNGNVVKIIDFNFSDSSDSILLKNPSGTRKYMAPEQFSPDAQPSAVADIYSLGVILSELAAATGDGSLASVAEKCMNPNPAQRPQSTAFLKLPSTEPSTLDRFYQFFSSKTLTYILLCICAVLTAMIAYLLITNY